MACKHWYSGLVHALADGGHLEKFLQESEWLTESQMGGWGSSPFDSESEEEEEDEPPSPLGLDHNRIVKQLIIRTAVRAVDRFLNEGSLFEKKKSADDMVRRINRTEAAKAHNRIKGDDAVKNIFTHLYRRILRQQIPSAVWMSLGPFCAGAHQPSQPYPSSIVLSTDNSLADSWFFSSSFYRTSKAGENLTEPEKQACESLTLFFNSGKVPCKSEAQIVSMVRKSAGNFTKLYNTLSKKYPCFVPPVARDHAYGICWRSSLEQWLETPAQKKHILLMSSLYPGLKPCEMSEVAQLIYDHITRIPYSQWERVLGTIQNDLVLGNFYFAQFCGSPPPENLQEPFRLWGSSDKPLEAVAPSPSRQALVHKCAVCNALVAAAYTITELLRESFKKKFLPLSEEQVDRVYRMWATPGGLSGDDAQKTVRGTLRLLKRANMKRGPIRFTKRFTRWNYGDRLAKFLAVRRSNPDLLCTVVMLARSLATTGSLPEDLSLIHISEPTRPR